MNILLRSACPIAGIVRPAAVRRSRLALIVAARPVSRRARVTLHVQRPVAGTGARGLLRVPPGGNPITSRVRAPRPGTPRRPVALPALCPTVEAGQGRRGTSGAAHWCNAVWWSGLAVC